MDTSLLTTQPLSTPAASAPSSKHMRKVEESARDFEAMFISEMVKPMFEGIKTDGNFGGGKGEEVFRGLLIEEYGKVLAQSGGIGMSSAIRDEMIKMQETADGKTTLETPSKGAQINAAH